MMQGLSINESCKECGCVSFQYDDGLGESVCVDCGLVIVINPFEETVRYGDLKDEDNRKPNTTHLGSYILPSDIAGQSDWSLFREQIRSQPESSTDRRMKVLLSMYLSYYNIPPNLKKRANSYYKTMNKDRLFVGLPVEKRAAALTFYMLKELDIVCNIREHSKHTRVERADISKIARKIAKYQKKSHVFIETNHISKLQVLLSKLEANDIIINSSFRENAHRMVEYVSRHMEALDMRYSNNLLVATVWIAGRMLDYPVHQYMLCEVWPSSTLGLRQSAKKICEIFNIDRSNLSKIDIDEFVLGVRC